MKIYIASSWKNAQDVQRLAHTLRNYGHEVFDFTDMENRPDGLDKFVFGAKQWAEHSGKNPDQIDWIDFLTWEPTQRAFRSDKAGIDWADVVILLLPSGRSSHLEAGYAVGCGKPLFIVGDLSIGEFDAMYGFATKCFRSPEWHRLYAVLNTLHHRLQRSADVIIQDEDPEVHGEGSQSISLSELEDFRKHKKQKEFVEEIIDDYWLSNPEAEADVQRRRKERELKG